MKFLGRGYCGFECPCSGPLLARDPFCALLLTLRLLNKTVLLNGQIFAEAESGLIGLIKADENSRDYTHG